MLSNVELLPQRAEPAPWAACPAVAAAVAVASASAAAAAVPLEDSASYTCTEAKYVVTAAQCTLPGSPNRTTGAQKRITVGNNVHVLCFQVCGWDSIPNFKGSSKVCSKSVPCQVAGRNGISGDGYSSMHLDRRQSMSAKCIDFTAGGRVASAYAVCATRRGSPDNKCTARTIVARRC